MHACPTALVAVRARAGAMHELALSQSIVVVVETTIARGPSW